VLFGAHPGSLLEERLWMKPERCCREGSVDTVGRMWEFVIGKIRQLITGHRTVRYYTCILKEELRARPVLNFSFRPERYC